MTEQEMEKCDQEVLAAKIEKARNILYKVLQYSTFNITLIILTTHH